MKIVDFGGRDMTPEIAIVTSFNKSGFDLYGKRFIESLDKQLSCNAMLFMGIAADVDEDPIDELLSKSKHLEWGYILLEPRKFVCCSDWNEIEEFKQRNRDFVLPPGSPIKKEIIKFSNKSFAMWKAWQETGWADRLIWLDADIFVHSPLPKDMFESFSNPNVAINYLGREHLKKPMYSETGCLQFNLKHPDTARFFDAFIKMYTEDNFLFEAEYHDAYLATVVMDRENISRHSWSSDWQTTHPFINSQLGLYFDHLKGPRKEKGSSGKHEIINPLIKNHPYWN